MSHSQNTTVCYKDKLKQEASLLIICVVVHKHTRRKHSTHHGEITFAVMLLPCPTLTSEPRHSIDNQTNWSWRSPEAIRAHNYLSFNKMINALSESDRCKLWHAKIDSLVGWLRLWSNGREFEKVFFFIWKVSPLEWNVLRLNLQFLNSMRTKSDCKVFSSLFLITKNKCFMPSITNITKSRLAVFVLLDS